VNQHHTRIAAIGVVEPASRQALTRGDQDLRNRIERAVTRLRADLGLTMPSGVGQRLLPSLAWPYRDEPGR
jgi:hypothetical protein